MRINPNDIKGDNSRGNMWLFVFLGLSMFNHCHCSNSGRIISGQVVTQDDRLNFPYHIQLRPVKPPGSPYCGGVLISPKFEQVQPHIVSESGASFISELF